MRDGSEAIEREIERARGELRGCVAFVTCQPVYSEPRYFSSAEHLTLSAIKYSKHRTVVRSMVPSRAVRLRYRCISVYFRRSHKVLVIALAGSVFRALCNSVLVVSQPKQCLRVTLSTLMESSRERKPRNQAHRNALCHSSDSDDNQPKTQKSHNYGIELDDFLGLLETSEQRKRRMKIPQLPHSYNETAPVPEIDFVYKWVNHTSASHCRHRADSLKWTKRMKKYRSPTGALCMSLDAQQDSVRHERDNDELRYALRSIFMHADWFRHIFLVVEGPYSVPEWLDMGHPRISVIFHSDIFPQPVKDFLPTFNSHAITSVLHRIPCLSEYYIAMDDDFFLTSDVSPSDFFSIKDGNVIAVKGIFAGDSISPELSTQRCRSDHHHQACNANSAYLAAKFMGGVGKDELNFRKLQHAPYASSKTLQYTLIDDWFACDSHALRTHRFRTKADFHVQSLVLNLASMDPKMTRHVFNVQAVESNAYSIFVNVKSERLEELDVLTTEKLSTADFLCINDGMAEIIPEEVRKSFQRFLAKSWSVAAPWEKCSRRAAGNVGIAGPARAATSGRLRG